MYIKSLVGLVAAGVLAQSALAAVAPLEVVPAAGATPAEFLLAATFPTTATYVCFRAEAPAEPVCTGDKVAVVDGKFPFRAKVYTGAPAGTTAVALVALKLTPGAKVAVADGNTTGEVAAGDSFAVAIPLPPAPIPFTPTPVTVVTPPVDPPVTGAIFQDGFETGTASAWSGTHGPASYAAAGCRSGTRCGAMTLPSGSDQFYALWSKVFTHSGPVLYASGWWKFPVGYDWSVHPKTSFPDSPNHKLMIFNTADSVGRMHVVLNGNGTSPILFITAEKTEPKPPGIVKYSNVHWPPDGQWHRVELQADRVSGDTSGRMRVWLDGQLAIDERGRICGTPCSPIVGMEIGAYVNQGSGPAQTFYVDDVLISGNPRS